MIRAKKMRLLKVLSITGSVILSGTISALVSFKILANKEKPTSIGVSHDRGEGPSLVTNVKVVILEKQNSNTDANLEEKIEDLTTTINFKEGDAIRKTVIKMTKPNEELVFDINSEIPTGFILDPERYKSNTEIKIEPGSTVDIYIVKEQKTFETILKFFENGEELKDTEKKLQLKEGDSIKLSDHLPEGYEIVPGTSDQIVVGFTNNFQVQKIIKKVTTTLIYLNSRDSDKEVFRKEITGPENQSITNFVDYIPSGYKLDDTKPLPSIETGKENKIYLLPLPVTHRTTIVFKNVKNQEILQTEVVNTTDDQKITKEQIQNLIKNPQLYELTSGFDINNITIDGTNVVYLQAKIIIVNTTFEYREGNNLIYTYKVQSEDKAQIGINQVKNNQPYGYTVTDDTPQSFAAGSVYTIKVVKNPDPVKITQLIFKDGESVVKTETLRMNTIDLSKYIPKGYQLINSNYQVKVGEVNTINIMKIRFYVEYIYYVDADNSNSYTHSDTNQEFIANSHPQYYDEGEQAPSYTKFVPSGYEVKKDFSTAVSQNRITYIPVVKKNEPEKKYHTTLIYKYNGEELKKTPFTTKGNEEISINDIKYWAPKDAFENGKLIQLTLKLSNIHINIGQENVIEMTKLIKKITTTITLVSDDRDIQTISVITENDDPIKIEDIKNQIPQGYRIKNLSQLSSITPGSTTTVEIISNTAPVTRIKPKKPVNDERSSLSFTGDAGSAPVALRDLGLTNYDPKTNPKDISKTDRIAKAKTGLENFLNILNKHEDINKEDLTSIFDKLAPDSLHLVEAYVDILNKNDAEIGGFIPKSNLTKEQKRELFKDNLNWILSKLDEEARNGKAPVLHFGNLGFNFGYVNDAENPVLQRAVQANKQRAFSNAGYYPRTGGDLLQGDYKGWTKTDISSNSKFSGLITPVNERRNTTLNDDGTISEADDGIRIYEYRPDADNLEPKDRSPKELVDVDATNKKGLDKIITLLNSEAGKSLYGLTIRSIGANRENQDLGWLYRSIPSNIKKLTLIFSSQKTQGIGYLRNHRFDEIELIADVNNNDDKLDPKDNQGIGKYTYGWGIDPTIFRNTKFAPKNYNTVKGWDNIGSTEKNAGGITFDVIRPDKDATESIVKEGFKIALKDKASWKVFNGNWGNEGFPTKVDLSLTKLKGLKGVNIYGKRFKVLKLHSDTRIFTIDSSELGKAQYEALEAEWAPNEGNPKVFFDTDVDSLRIAGNAVDLTNGWNTQLYALMHGMTNARNLRTIYVDNEKMRETIRNSGAYSTFGSGINIEIYKGVEDADIFE